MARLAKCTLSLLILFGLTLLTQAQQAEKKTDPWDPWKFFIGNWEGTGQGEPGESKVERSYEFVLEGKFLLAKNKSFYPPRKKILKAKCIQTGVYSAMIWAERNLSFASFMWKALSISMSWTVSQPMGRL